MRFLHFMTEGGWGMWFVLTFGLISLGAATGFARRPRPEGEWAVRSFSRATTFSMVSTLCLDLAAVGSRVSNDPAFAQHPRIHLVVLEGIAESLAPVILGSTLLCFVWLVMAVGQRRLARQTLP